MALFGESEKKVTMPECWLFVVGMFTLDQAEWVVNPFVQKFFLIIISVRISATG